MRAGRSTASTATSGIANRSALLALGILSGSAALAQVAAAADEPVLRVGQHTSENREAPREAMAHGEEASSGQDGTADPQRARSSPQYLGGHVPPQPENIRQAGWFRKFLFWLGQFHPPAINFPIGLILAAAIAETLRMTTGRPLFTAASRFCIWVGAVGALVAGVLGWFLAGFDLGGRHWLLDTHRWLGTATALWALLVLALSEASHRRSRKAVLIAFRATLFVAAALVLTTGFFGGAMIYGVDHYAWPTAPDPADREPTDGAAEEQAADGPAVTVEMTDEMTFEPRSVTIAAGETIRWTNPSSVFHTVTADPSQALNPQESVELPERAEPFDSGRIEPGETYSRRFTVPGSYTYFCVPHEAAGMIGEIVVEPD